MDWLADHTDRLGREANLYRMRALESERKLRLAMVQVRRLEGVRSMFRWQRIVLQLMHKGIKRSSRRKVCTLVLSQYVNDVR